MKPVEVEGEAEENADATKEGYESLEELAAGGVDLGLTGEGASRVPSTEG